MKMNRFWAGLILLTLLLAACVPASGEVNAEVSQRAEEIAARLVTAIDAGDLTAFHADMNAQMTAAFDQKAFDDLRALFQTRLGDYKSMKMTSISLSDQYYVALFEMEYEKSPKVVMRLVLETSQPYLLSGLWFDSAELR